MRGARTASRLFLRFSHSKSGAKKSPNTQPAQQEANIWQKNYGSIPASSVLFRNDGHSDWNWGSFKVLGGVGLVGLGCCNPSGQAESKEPFADRNALVRAKAVIRDAWNEIEHDLVELGVNLPDVGEPKILLADNRLSIRLKVRKEADLSAVIVELVHGLTGLPGESAVKDGAMKLNVAECGVARVLQFEKLQEPSAGNKAAKEKGMFAQVFVPTFSDDLPEVEFLKPGALSNDDLKAIGKVMKVANSIRNNHNWGTFQVEKMEDMMGKELEKIEGMVGFMLRDFHNFFEKKDRKRPPEWQSSPEDMEGDARHNDEHRSEDLADQTTDSIFSQNLVGKLENMGVKVFLPHKKNKVDWGILAGYEDQKRRIEDGLLLPLLHPQVFDDVARKTRRHFVTNRPRGVLFEGPPGTGKTTSARVIASQAAVPMVYIPLEAVMSKWYGEAEKLLATVFQNADKLGGSIIFLDEIETLATTRSAEMHEATRRLLGVLLREMDGFDTSKRTVVIGATNRKQDVDPALLSRFDASVKFDLPDKECRQLIIEQYAQHLTKEEILMIVKKTDAFSGRDLRDVCEQTERGWASKIVREEVAGGQLPGVKEYLQSACLRHKDLE